MNNAKPTSFPRRTEATRTEPIVEEGMALAHPQADEQFDVIVIGAAQAGLSAGYYLRRSGTRFVILDAGERIGDSWRKRWDSLRLFTPARYDSLVGMPFPAPNSSFPTKDEMADYLEDYATRFGLPVRCGVRVQRLTRDNDRYVLETDRGVLEARHVVVAMGNYQRRKTPPFAGDLRPGIVQLHSADYRNPGQLAPGAVLIAGAGNSGAEIALEAARGHRTWMAGRDTGALPFRIAGFWGRWILVAVVLRFVFQHLLTVKTPWGRRLRTRILHKGGPLIRVKQQDLAAAGVERVPRVVGVRDGLPVLDDGCFLDVTNVVWCTGYDAASSFIELPIFDEHGDPRHQGGIVHDEPGLYFLGLHFLFAMSSGMIHGVARDARRIAEVIKSRIRATDEVALAAAVCLGASLVSRAVRHHILDIL